jgi:hypothetical protein
MSLNEHSRQEKEVKHVFINDVFFLFDFLL